MPHNTRVDEREEEYGGGVYTIAIFQGIAYTPNVQAGVSCWYLPSYCTR